MNETYAVYPNMRAHLPDEHGYLRWGVVVDNVDTREKEIHGFCPAGQPAVVTQEEDRLIRYYIYTQTRATMCFPGVTIWVGPFDGISEDIESKGDDDE